MGLEKLTIQVEKKGSKLSFDSSETIIALFNPDKLSFTKSVNWKQKDPTQHDVPELQFTNAQPRTLILDLIFDTYDNKSDVKGDVRKYTDEIFHLATVDGDKHRPPVCRLIWGSVGVFFQGVLVKLDQKFTLFMEDGTPVRATSSCIFKEWRTNSDDLNMQAKQSSDIVKTRIIKRGETLSSIAAEEYDDAMLWRPIAIENNIDDPNAVLPGVALKIPTLTNRSHNRRMRP